MITDPQQLYDYGHDHTLNWHFSFDILLKPGSVDEISAVLKICNQFHIPVTPRGGGSGVTGGALPVKGGVVLSLERLNKIISINETEHYVVAEAGVITLDLCNAVEQIGLYFPIAPGSSSFSCIGGNVAENAGSPRSAKYGTTLQWVLNLEVVLADGAVIWTGANVSKNTTGLNLTQLFIGSEGILGIITKVVYKLIPVPQTESLLLVAFESVEQACKVVNAIKESNIFPSAVELICRNALQLVSSYLKTPMLLVKDNIYAHLLIELQETNRETLAQCLDTIKIILLQHTSEQWLLTNVDYQKEDLCQLRFSIGKAMTAFGMAYRDIDACVPVNILQEYIEYVEAVCEAAGITVIVFGHALDGNLHSMLLFDSSINIESNIKFKQVVDSIFKFVVIKGGVISGEHGIGYLQKEGMSLQFSTNQLALMRNIKKAVDPGNILNPGKIFDME